MRTKTIDKCKVAVTKGGVLKVIEPNGKVTSVLPVGTHAAIRHLRPSTKKKIVEYWKSKR